MPKGIPASGIAIIPSIPGHFLCKYLTAKLINFVNALGKFGITRKSI
jgi:hypothetical protein